MLLEVKSEEIKKMENLGRKGAIGGELVANEVAGGDVRNAEKVAETGGVGALADAGAAQEDPLDVPVLTRRRVRIG